MGAAVLQFRCFDRIKNEEVEGGHKEEQETEIL